MEKLFYRKMAYIFDFWRFGEKLNYFYGFYLGSKDKIILGRQGNYFQRFGEVDALFSGITGAQTPLGTLKKEMYSFI